jgi:hypothetical protein
MIEVYPTRYPPEFCSPDGTLIFDRVARHYHELVRLGAPLDAADAPWLRYLDACGLDAPVYSSARIYYHLFDGLPCDDRITDALLKLRVGGTEANLAGTRYRMSVYGRRGINTRNLSLLHREYIDLPDIGSVGLDQNWRYWRDVTVDEEDIDEHPVRCVVVKMEQMAKNTYVEQNAEYNAAGADQAGLADPPMWGMRLTEASIWASSLRREVTPEAVVEDIVSPYWSGDRFWCPDSSGVECDQVVFDSIPKSRLDALLEIDEMLDWDIEATRDRFTYRKPTTLGEARDDELYTVSLADPGYTGTITPAMDECCNGARIVYTTRTQTPKELVAHWDSEYLGDADKTRVFTLPESVRSRAQALACVPRLEASYAEPPIAGSATLVGSVPVASGEDRDVLLVRPGELLQVQDAPRTFRRTEREISSVVLQPMNRQADVELGAKSRRFEKWLKRVAARRPKS